MVNMEKIRDCADGCKYRNSANLCHYGKVCRGYPIRVADWDDWKENMSRFGCDTKNDLARFDIKACGEINTRATIAFSALVDLLKAILPSENISDAMDDSENMKWTRVYIDALAHLGGVIHSCDEVMEAEHEARKNNLE